MLFQALERFDVLRDTQPSFIILYDPEISIIRGIEGYQSSIPQGEVPVKVFFLMYGKSNSVESMRVNERRSARCNVY